jgi:predicted GH43/DUF377 family glycosyl hydrolase
MPKQIVGKSEIKTDPKLTLIKAFRTLNKRCGELKAKIAAEDTTEDDRAEAVTAYETNAKKMQALSEKALADYQIHIWVGFDGATGHTYEKDYKVTRTEANDWDAFQAELTAQNSEVDNLINSINLPDEEADIMN